MAGFCVFLLAKCLYDRYLVKKTRLLPDIANEAELCRHDRDTQPSNDISESNDPSRWIHRRTVNFYPSANRQRYSTVAIMLNEYKGKLWKVVDFGCAKLDFLSYLKDITEVEQILCVDVDREVLEEHKYKAERLIGMAVRERKLTIEICEGSVTDNDVKLKHTNAVICMELIQHLYPDTLIDLPFNIFGYIKPEVAIITASNVEFNVLLTNLSNYRHPDRKFEWTRKQFQDWAQNIVIRYPYYSVTFHGICNGPEGTEELGALTQMAVFRRILPKNEPRIDSLTPIEYVQLRGHALFKTVAKYNYPARIPDYSDEQKILDEVTNHIYHLVYDQDESEELENFRNYISLDYVVNTMPKFTIEVETLRSVLTNAGWDVIDKENKPVVLVPYENSFNDETSSSEDYSSEDYSSENYSSEDYSCEDTDYGFLMESDSDSDETLSYEESDSMNAENIRNCVTGRPIDEIPADANEENLSQQNPRTEDCHEEPDITNKNRLDHVTSPSIDEILADENENLSEQNRHTEKWSEEPNFTNEMNRRNCEYGLFINQTLADTNEEYSPVQNLSIENCHEEPSIIIPENCPINQENTYLFDDENSVTKEFQLSTEPCVTCDNIKHSGVRNTADSLVYTEQELPSDTISLTLSEIEVETQVIASNVSSAALDNSLRLKTSVDSDDTPRLGVLEPIEMEKGDLANNRDAKGNNMMAMDTSDIANLQLFNDILENDLENENVMQNGFPIWLLRLLNMANPFGFHI